MELADSKSEGSLRAAESLRTDGRNFAGDSSADGYWRETYAGNPEGQRHADKSKNKTVVVFLEIGFLVGV
jgi:hypothetical protein